MGTTHGEFCSLSTTHTVQLTLSNVHWVLLTVSDFHLELLISNINWALLHRVLFTEHYSHWVMFTEHYSHWVLFTEHYSHWILYTENYSRWILFTENIEYCSPSTTQSTSYHIIINSQMIRRLIYVSIHVNHVHFFNNAWQNERKRNKNLIATFPGV